MRQVRFYKGLKKLNEKKVRIQSKKFHLFLRGECCRSSWPPTTFSMMVILGVLLFYSHCSVNTVMIKQCSEYIESEKYISLHTLR